MEERREGRREGRRGGKEGGKEGGRAEGSILTNSKLHVSNEGRTNTAWQAHQGEISLQN